MKKKTTKNIIPFCVTIIFIITGLFLMYQLLTYNYSKQSAYKMTGGWDIMVNGEIHRNVSLSDMEFHNIKKGQSVSFKHDIPETILENETLLFQTYLSSVSVSLDERTIYNYATKIEDADNIIGSGCHFVVIPPNSARKPLIINVTAKEDNAFTNMEDIIIVPTSDASSYYINQRIFAIFISIFLLVLGIVLSFISAVALINNSSNLALTYIGVFSFLMGLWSMNNSKLLQIFNIDLGASTTSEYFSLFAATIPIILLFGEIRKGDSKFVQIGIKIISGIFALFLVVTTILHFTRVTHFSQVLGMFHAMVALTIVFMLVTKIKKTKKKNVSERAMSFGFFILCLSFAADLVRFNVHKYLMPNNTSLIESFVPIGTFLFIIFLLYSYANSILEMMHEKTQQAVLSHIAYHDNLCKIYNRAQCDKDFEELEQTNGEYALVNLDLNGLKAINDQLGHTSGDLLLRSFAEILEESFCSVGTCYRMGGDEFLVIVKKEHLDGISGCIEQMKRLEQEKSKELEFTIEASYGIAYRSDVPEGTTAKVYSLADQRMYEMKQASKKKA